MKNKLSSIKLRNCLNGFLTERFFTHTNDLQTTIWEKGDNPLFASKIKFSKADRVHLVTGEPSVTHADIRFYGEAFHSKRNKTNQFMSDKQFGMSDQISQWDLVINFLQPADSDTYTCRLVGRTQQLIQYRVNVKGKSGISRSFVAEKWFQTSKEQFSVSRFI